MMKFRENEEAVSPVIGVILMVAITVILAAVIAAFVFGMTDSLTPQKEVYVTTKLIDDGTDKLLMVTIQGGKNVGDLNKIDALFTNAADTTTVESEPATTSFTVGDSIMFKIPDTTETYSKIVFRGHFTDNTVAILAETVYNGAGA